MLAGIFWSGWRAYTIEDTLTEVMKETAKTTSLVFIILLGAAMLTSAFRGFGGPEGAIYSEILMDRIAQELNLPVLSVKHANLTREGDLLHYGQSRVRGCTLEQCWQECLDKSQYALKYN